MSFTCGEQPLGATIAVDLVLIKRGSEVITAVEARCLSQSSAEFVQLR